MKDLLNKEHYSYKIHTLLMKRSAKKYKVTLNNYKNVTYSVHLHLTKVYMNAIYDLIIRY